MSAPCILVLSPLAENRERLCEWLAPLGRECRALADADALWSALWEARLDPPALLVFDGHPAEDSYPLINRLQGDQAGAQLPVILLSDNLADSSRRFYAELLHGVESLAKPLNPEALRQSAAACLALDDGRRGIEAVLQGADWSQTLKEGLLGLDADGLIRYANRQAARWLRLTPLTLCNLNVQSLMQTPVTHVDRPWGDSPLGQASSGHSAMEIQRLTLWRGDGGSQLVQAAMVALPDSPYAWLLAFRIVEADSSTGPNLAELARVDLLTGLPTRAHLEDALPPLLMEGRRLALMLLDIDHLRHVNDTLGHDFGDQLLRAAAARLRGAREAGLLASMGGGRFAFLVEEVADFRVAGRIAQRLQSQFRLPFLLAGHEVFCSVSIGIALHPVSGDDSTQLMHGAERALERAKAVGRNVIQFDSAELNRFTIERLEREAAFHQALMKDGEIGVAWRLWRNARGQVVAVQPRATWPTAPAGTPVQDLGRLAEECGLSRELSDWLFRQAATSPQLPRPLPASLSLAFAVSTPQILDPFVVQRLRAWLARHGIDPARVLLLVPWREDEAALLRQRLPELAAEGVRLALHMNGHGSAMDAFAMEAWDAVVIGRDYVQRQPAGRGLDVIGALADFGHRLGWQVYADGLPPGATAEMVFAAGINACSEDLEQLPEKLD